MIYVDVSAAVHSRAGLGRYAQSLAQSLVEIEPERIGFFYNEGRGGRFPGSLEGYPCKRVGLGYKPWRMLLYLANLGHFSFQSMLPGVELFHSTEHLLMSLRHTPTVLTVHDLIYKLYPEYHKRLNYWYLNLAMPLFCRRASAIIAVSEATKRDIVRYYGVDPAKIFVVYEAAASVFKPPTQDDIARVRKEYRLPDRYILHISTIDPRKNLDRLVDATVILRKEFPELQLVLVGGRGWLCDDFFKRIASPELAQAVTHLGWMDDQDLPAVIGAASLGVQPSLYEGFGLPVLEHMACGQVVAASDSSSHPEVGGDAAAYFDPAAVDQMVRTIRRLLLDKNEYRRRKALGLAQAEKFSWRNAAADTIAIYDLLLERSRSHGKGGTGA